MIRTMDDVILAITSETGNLLRSILQDHIYVVHLPYRSESLFRQRFRALADKFRASPTPGAGNPLVYTLHGHQLRKIVNEMSYEIRTSNRNVLPHTLQSIRGLLHSLQFLRVHVKIQNHVYKIPLLDPNESYVLTLPQSQEDPSPNLLTTILRTISPECRGPPSDRLDYTISGARLEEVLQGISWDGLVLAESISSERRLPWGIQEAKHLQRDIVHLLSEIRTLDEAKTAQPGLQWTQKLGQPKLLPSLLPLDDNPELRDSQKSRLYHPNYRYTRQESSDDLLDVESPRLFSGPPPSQPGHRSSFTLPTILPPIAAPSSKSHRDDPDAASLTTTPRKHRPKRLSSTNTSITESEKETI